MRLRLYIPHQSPPSACELHGKCNNVIYCHAQASLGDGNDKDRVTLRCKVAGEDEDGALGEEIIIAVFEHGKAESQTLDLIFDTYTEFTVKGAREVCSTFVALHGRLWKSFIIFWVDTADVMTVM